MSEPNQTWLERLAGTLDNGEVLEIKRTKMESGIDWTLKLLPIHGVGLYARDSTIENCAESIYNWKNT